MKYHSVNTGPIIMLGLLGILGGGVEAGASSGVLGNPEPVLKRDVCTPYTGEAALAGVGQAPLQQATGGTSLINSQLVGRVTRDAIQRARQDAAAPYQALTLPDGSALGDYGPALDGADIYRIQYRSTRNDGEATILSGLVSVPAKPASDGLVVYMHATKLASDTGAASLPSPEACSMLTAFAGEERVVALPDYLGYGVNQDPHPYPFGKYNVRAGIDIVTAARELVFQLTGAPPDSRLYVTGYSEGGGNALWLARALEEEQAADLHPTLIVPMAGNYDMTGATAQSLIVKQPKNSTTRAAKPVLLTFTAQATWEITGSDPGSLLRPVLVKWSQRNAIPMPNQKLNSALAALSGAATRLGYPVVNANPKVLLNPSLVEAITDRDLGNPALKLWFDNDNIDWAPQAQVYAVGILQDEIVPFAGSAYPVPENYTGGPAFFTQGNSENLIRAMRKRGLGSDRVGWLGIDSIVPSGAQAKPGAQNQRITHINGLVPVSILAARFIRQGTLAQMPVLPDPQ
ncbi:alpha/beta hydrolase family protein [Methylococcus mesophilus]|uniref:alpha/beta hydrolase family protein n=1 Tax=Methylococcus mesophilus TaxID=2993564 RepID=UPI00224B9CA4|nr:hypothetical protein [Methylococcus mesophilus]UZR27518.1 hypothetical protein OOT43_12315 [Methylococcus mesophilus]